MNRPIKFLLPTRPTNRQSGQPVRPLPPNIWPPSRGRHRYHGRPAPGKREQHRGSMTGRARSLPREKVQTIYLDFCKRSSGPFTIGKDHRVEPPPVRLWRYSGPLGTLRTGCLRPATSTNGSSGSRACLCSSLLLHNEVLTPHGRRFFPP
jgi:hypothetical protein